MASRSHSWFDAEKLLPGAKMLRAGVSRVRTDTPPYWWQGDLVLTSDRLFFLPHTANPLLARTAFWLHDLIDVGPAGRNRLHVRTAGEAGLFQVLDVGPGATIGRGAVVWLRLIEMHRRSARRSAAFDDRNLRRRAAG